MADTLSIPLNATREGIYISLVPQIESLVEGENDFIANVSNIMAALHQAFGFLWVGCYFVKNDELVLGPFQGPVACTRIKKGKGVCGTAWQKNETIVVADVEQFPGHIACSSFSKSEIVVPLRNSKQEIVGVLDVDSTELNHFSSTDSIHLERIASFIGKLLERID
ncbi:MAG: GAF domain-containing protein [Flavobacteriales bacterium]|nr:GAF domain-containing protein [Flavobacteriales bacterium]